VLVCLIWAQCSASDLKYCAQHVPQESLFCVPHFAYTHMVYFQSSDCCRKALVGAREMVRGETVDGSGRGLWVCAVFCCSRGMEGTRSGAASALPLIRVVVLQSE
jgi:hypothetical protein